MEDRDAEKAPYPHDEEQQPVMEPPIRIPLHVRFWLSLKMGVVRKLLPVWAVGLALSIFVVYMLQNLIPPGGTEADGGMFLFVATAVVSLVFMYIDSTLGMGYGTTLTPILIIMG